MGEQRAADRDALLLAARQRGRAALEQVADAEQLDDRGEIAGRRRRRRGEPAAVEQVLAHGEMREQPASWKT